MSPLTLSVVIPVYNEEAAIGDCVERLARLSPPVDEILVVDNNSTDDTASVVEALTATVPSLRLVREERQGARFAAARGIADATGDLVAKIDADTLVNPGWSAAVHDFFAKVDDDVAGGSGMCSMHDLPFQGVFRKMQARAAATVAERLDRGELSSVTDTFGANCVLRAGAWKDIAPHLSERVDVQDDLDIGIVAVDRGWRLGWIPGLEARISGRRLCTSPASYWQYTARTPRTFAAHGKRAAMIKSLIGVTGARALQAVFWPILRMWDPESSSFRLGGPRNAAPERVLP